MFKISVKMSENVANVMKQADIINIVLKMIKRVIW